MTADLRYPIGRMPKTDRLDSAQREETIARVAALPARLRSAVGGLDDRQLDTPYRNGGWTVRQVVHHLADSHLNAFVRFKLGLTEERPVIKPYDEVRWAELPDSRLPIAASLEILDGLHARWTALLREVPDTAWRRVIHHPEQGRDIPLDELLGMYAWHGDHHLAHVTALAAKEGWGATAPEPPA
jgi:uncharacterized damage-inducible protein DinB